MEEKVCHTCIENSLSFATKDTSALYPDDNDLSRHKKMCKRYFCVLKSVFPAASPNGQKTKRFNDLLAFKQTLERLSHSSCCP